MTRTHAKAARFFETLAYASSGKKDSIADFGLKTPEQRKSRKRASSKSLSKTGTSFWRGPGSESKGKE